MFSQKVQSTMSYFAVLLDLSHVHVLRREHAQSNRARALERSDNAIKEHRVLEGYPPEHTTYLSEPKLRRKISLSTGAQIRLCLIGDVKHISMLPLMAGPHNFDGQAEASKRPVM
jgi:hypothetical protein